MGLITANLIEVKKRRKKADWLAGRPAVILNIKATAGQPSSHQRKSIINFSRRAICLDGWRAKDPRTISLLGGDSRAALLEFF